MQASPSNSFVSIRSDGAADVCITQAGHARPTLPRRKVELDQPNVEVDSHERTVASGHEKFVTPLVTIFEQGRSVGRIRALW